MVFCYVFLSKVSTSTKCFTADHARQASLCECYLGFIKAMHKIRAFFSLMRVPIHV
jgi:hypothetical protein